MDILYTIYYRDMSQNNSQVQYSDSENHQPTSISTSYNPQDAETSTVPNGDAYHVTAAQSHVVPFQLLAPVINSPVQTNSSTNLQITVHPTVFYFRPPRDFYHYHVNCKEIPYNEIILVLNKSLNCKFHFNGNENIFFYQQQINNRIYQVSCEIVSSLTLNKSIYGIEIEQNFVQHLAFTSDQKGNLKFHLTQYLRHYLLD